MLTGLALALLLFYGFLAAAAAAASSTGSTATIRDGGKRRGGKGSGQRPTAEAAGVAPGQGARSAAGIGLPSGGNEPRGPQAASTGSALELFSHWSEPPWSRQPNGSVCAPMHLGAFLRLQALFKEVAALLATLGVQWIISHGSLLGAWLHHGPVPWDEEGDIVLLPEDFARLRASLGPPADAEIQRAPGGRMWLYEGPKMGSLQYDYHEHSSKGGGWLATAVTFRHASEPRNSSVHLDAFLARTNGTHVWTDSAVMPLEVLLPVRRIRFYDWLVPAPFDPKAALHLWYGPHFVGRRKCALRRPDGEAAGIEQIAEVSGLQISHSYPMTKNEWLSEQVVRCTVHLNRSVLWVFDLDTINGHVSEVSGLSLTPRLDNLVSLALRSPASAWSGDEHEYSHRGAFPDSVENLWD